jgi:ketosteroid isomerase-like protein
MRRKRAALPLLRLAGSLALVLLPLVLVGAVAAVEAAGGRAEHAVMTREMAGDAADRRALQAAPGVGGRRCRERKHRGGGKNGSAGFHGPTSPNEFCKLNEDGAVRVPAPSRPLHESIAAGAHGNGSQPLIALPRPPVDAERIFSQCRQIRITPAEEPVTDNPNRQRVKSFLAVFASGDVEGALACCSDDVEFTANAPIDILPHMNRHRGKAELRKMWQTVHSRYSGMRYEMPIIVAEGETVAVLLRAYFRKRSNDRIVQFDLAAFYTLRDGLITRIREILDSFDLVQQVLERDVGALLTGDGEDGE